MALIVAMTVLLVVTGTVAYLHRSTSAFMMRYRGQYLRRVLRWLTSGTPCFKAMNAPRHLPDPAASLSSFAA